MFVGGDFNGDVGSNMDRVFQIVVRARGVGKSPTGEGSWKFCWGDMVKT